MAASFAICAVQGRVQEFLRDGEIEADEGGLIQLVRNLGGKVGNMLPYMADADGRRLNEDNEIRQVMEKTRDVCYQVEDVLDNLAAKIASSIRRRRRKRSLKGFAERCIIIHGTNRGGEAADAQRLKEAEAQIHTLIETVGSLTQRLRSLGLTEAEEYEAEGYNEISWFSVYFSEKASDREEPIGIGEAVKAIALDLLNVKRGQSVQVMCLEGAGGSGKTTHAREVSKYLENQGFFERFAWVTVSEMYGTISVFKDVLVQLVPELEKEINQLEDVAIAEKLFQVLRSKKCLIVLDDLVSPKVWETLRFAFAYEEINSRVLVTTRSIPSDLQTLAEENDWIIRKPSSLSTADAWKLFCKIAFALPQKYNRAREEEKHKMVLIGNNIADLFPGKPLIVIMLAKLLAPRPISYWEKVHRNIESYREFGKSGGAMEVLNEGYNKFPYYLKLLLSYMATFPGNSEIESERLYHLWIAEDILQLREGAREEYWIGTGPECLHDLSRKSLVKTQLDGVSSISRFKSCSLRNVTHQFCSSKLRESRFVEVIDLRRYSNTPPSLQAFPSFTRETRRLALYLDQYEDESLIDCQEKMLRALEGAHYLRTLLFVNVNRHQQCVLWPGERLNLENVRFLRVLGFDGCSFQATPLPKGIENLLLLRYLSLRGCYLEELPSYIGNLLYLQTLDLQVTASCKMIIPDDILCKLKRLMYLYFPIAFEAKGGGKLRLAELTKLQILKNFDTGVCDVQDLFKLNNIQILDVVTSGSEEDLKHLTRLIEERPSLRPEFALDVRNFDCYSTKRRDVITQLFSTKGPGSFCIDGRLGELPKSMDFDYVVKLCFRGSELYSDPMEKLGGLYYLKFLVLSDAAFVGKGMVCPRATFRELKQLELSGLHNLETLTIEEDALRALTTLAIKRCKRLQVSQGLRDLHKQKKLKIAKMPIEFENGLREVEQNSETSQSSAMMATRDELLFPEANH